MHPAAPAGSSPLSTPEAAFLLEGLLVGLPVGLLIGLLVYALSHIHIPEWIQYKKAWLKYSFRFWIYRWYVLLKWVPDSLNAPSDYPSFCMKLLVVFCSNEWVSHWRRPCPKPGVLAQTGASNVSKKQLPKSCPLPLGHQDRLPRLLWKRWWKGSSFVRV